jgi:hypothetical protein
MTAVRSLTTIGSGVCARSLSPGRGLAARLIGGGDHGHRWADDATARPIAAAEIDR